MERLAGRLGQLGRNENDDHDLRNRKAPHTYVIAPGCTVHRAAEEMRTRSHLSIAKDAMDAVHKHVCHAVGCPQSCWRKSHPLTHICAPSLA